MKRKKNPGTLVKQKVIFHLFFAMFTPLLFACPETVKKEATKQGEKYLEAHAAIERVSQD
jgi:hypothetical protein